MGDQSFEDMSRNIYLNFAMMPINIKRLQDNPVCEACKTRPSVRINRWGPIKACCEECLVEEQRRFDEHMAIEEMADCD